LKAVRFVVLLSGLLLLAGPLPAQPYSPNFLAWAETPPMGWNSWDVYEPSITEAEARANAEVMARELLPHGW